MNPFTTGVIEGGHVPWSFLIEIELAAGWLRYNVNQWDLEWNGHTWLAGDRAVSVELAVEDMSGQVNGSTIHVSSLDPATTSLALSETVEGRVAAIYFAVFNPQTYKISEAVRLFSGRVSNLTLTKVGEGG